MHTLLIILLSLALTYLAGLGTILLVSALVIRQKLRKYQENGRFGY
jgi:uncharacterized membrane protein